MPLTSRLGQSLKAHEDDSDDEPYSDELDASSPSVLDTGEGGGSIRSDDSENHQLGDGQSDTDDEENSVSGSDEDQEDVKKQLSTVSFGVRSKAQASLGKRKRLLNDTGEDKLEALRERLRELKRGKTSGGDQSGRCEKTASEAASLDSGPPHRTSKHAPAAQSSKKAVTRKRTIFEPPKAPALGDPRFSTLAGAVDEHRTKQNYSFLNDYREAEIMELRDTLRAAKTKMAKISNEDKEVLERKLMSLESRKKTEQEKERQAKVLREHRRQEKEAVKEGKKPFYLKRSEQKKLALVDKFSNMKAKERGHAIERRRKKDSAKEKKRMPSARRTVNA